MKQVIESWAAARGIQDIVTEFHLEPGYPEVESVCRAAPFPHEVHVNETRLGVQKNPWKAAGHALQSDDFVVLAEDDIIVGTDTVEYLRWAEKEFRYRDDVLAVSAAQGVLKEPGLYSAVAVERRFSAWVWGIWKDRWNLVGPDWKFNYEYKGWDYRLNFYWCQEQGYKTVIPHVSRAQHIGKYDGEHCLPEQFDSLLSACFVPDIGPQQYFVVE